MCRWRFPNDTLLAVEPGTLGGAGRDKFGIEVDILEIRMLDLVKDGRCFFLFVFFYQNGMAGERARQNSRTQARGQSSR